MSELDKILFFISVFTISFFLFDLIHNKMIAMKYEKEMKEINERLDEKAKNRKIYTFDDFKK